MAKIRSKDIREPEIVERYKREEDPYFPDDQKNQNQKVANSENKKVVVFILVVKMTELW